MPRAAPHPIPYQGSKRRLAERILARFPSRFERLFEPFCGSAAISLAAAARWPDLPIRLNDSFEPLAALWRTVIEDPHGLALRYEELWHGQAQAPTAFYERVRSDFNQRAEPGALLYLLARCVKSAVRFNRAGLFNQSADKRRLGTRPETMRASLLSASALLAGRASISSVDYTQALGPAGVGDLAYLDPPYEGTSRGADRRYHQPLSRGRLVQCLHELRERGTSVIVSLDGRSGDKRYGTPLPASLGLVRLELEAGRSSQATLHGRSQTTVESLYLSADLARELPAREPQLAAGS